MIGMNGNYGFSKCELSKLRRLEEKPIDENKSEKKEENVLKENCNSVNSRIVAVSANEILANYNYAYFGYESSILVPDKNNNLEDSAIVTDDAFDYTVPDRVYKDGDVVPDENKDLEDSAIITDDAFDYIEPERVS